MTPVFIQELFPRLDFLTFEAENDDPQPTPLRFIDTHSHESPVFLQGKAGSHGTDSALRCSEEASRPRRICRAPVIPGKCNGDPEQSEVEVQPDSYRSRNFMERLIGWLKEDRCVLLRFETNAKNYASMIKVAIIRHHLRNFGNHDF